jgi:hypothetical protein
MKNVFGGPRSVKVLDHLCYPTRVIDVRLDSNEDPKQHVSTSTEEGRYVALSYCWGDVQQIKTTSESLLRWVENIPFSALCCWKSMLIPCTQYLSG